MRNLVNKTAKPVSVTTLAEVVKKHLGKEKPS